MPPEFFEFLDFFLQIFQKDQLACPHRVFLARFETYLRRFDTLSVAETFTVEPFCDPREQKRGSKGCFSNYALGRLGFSSTRFEPGL